MPFDREEGASLYDVLGDAMQRRQDSLKGGKVRINGNLTERINFNGQAYALWAVEVLDEETNTWNMVTVCFGPASRSSALTILKSWEEGTVPSPLSML